MTAVVKRVDTSKRCPYQKNQADWAARLAVPNVGLTMTVNLRASINPQYWQPTLEKASRLNGALDGVVRDMESHQPGAKVPVGRGIFIICLRTPHSMTKVFMDTHCGECQGFGFSIQKRCKVGAARAVCGLFVNL